LSGRRSTGCKRVSSELSDAARIQADNLNGSVEISGWDQSTLDVSATRYAETQLLDALKVDIAVGSGGAVIRALPPLERGTCGKLEIAASNGAVQVRDIEGKTSVQPSNGAIHADLEDNRSGSVKLTTSNGGVELKLGPVTPGELTAATSNGSITMRITASAGARVKAGTSGNTRVASDLINKSIKSLDYALVPQYSPCVVSVSMHSRPVSFHWLPIRCLGRRDRFLPGGYGETRCFRVPRAARPVGLSVVFPLPDFRFRGCNLYDR